MFLLDIKNLNMSSLEDAWSNGLPANQSLIIRLDRQIYTSMSDERIYSLIFEKIVS